VVADRGYLNGEEILACKEAGITVTLPKPVTSNSKAEGRFGKQVFRYVAEEDVYICPAGQRLTYHYTNEENGLVLRHYWTNAAKDRKTEPKQGLSNFIWIKDLPRDQRRNPALHNRRRHGMANIQ
jgi:hypothetical protein